MNQVKIGPNFFQKEFKDYANWQWAYVRESLQNCFDAPGCDRITINVRGHDQNTVVEFANNGAPMDRETLENKLLALGESGKNFNNSVGGFGKAKVLLYLCHRSYLIRTGTIEVTGVGGNYELTEGLPYYHGTRSTVVMAGDQVAALGLYRYFCSLAQWPSHGHGTVTYNGERLECGLRKGTPRRDLSFGRVYTNKSFPGRLIVRINGIPMFWERIGLDRCVLVELNGTSQQALTSSRDGLLGGFRNELTEFIVNLAVNKRKALEPAVQKYQHFRGAKFRWQVDKVVEKQSHQSAWAASSTGAGVNPTTEQPISVSSSIPEEFVILNETDLKIPDYFRPDCDQFGKYSTKLLRVWGRLLLELHKLYGSGAYFAIGFCFSESALALYEDGPYGTVYYLNPALIKNNGKSRYLRKRYKLTEKDRLLSLAAHEFVHGLGYGQHNEDYAGKLTELMGLVLRERKRFNGCFR